MSLTLLGCKIIWFLEEAPLYDITKNAKTATFSHSMYVLIKNWWFVELGMRKDFYLYLERPTAEMKNIVKYVKLFPNGVMYETFSPFFPLCLRYRIWKVFSKVLHKELKRAMHKIRKKKKIESKSKLFSFFLETKLDFLNGHFNFWHKAQNFYFQQRFISGSYSD